MFHTGGGGKCGIGARLRDRDRCQPKIGRGEPAESDGTDANSSGDGAARSDGDPVNGGRGNRSLVDAGLIAELREMIGDDGSGAARDRTQGL